MWNPFKRTEQVKKVEPDWRYTGKQRWNVIKQIDTYRLEREQREAVDMNSGETMWCDVVLPPFAHRRERVIDLRDVNNE
jgi:hemolysin-activating ACP:hemolysin acyltransferase